MLFVAGLLLAATPVARSTTTTYSFNAHVVADTADGATAVQGGDIDGDGDTDIVASSFNDDTIAWYENDGSETFTKRTISTTADGARSVHVVDVDGDGDLDVISGSELDDTVAWYENDGSGGFTTHDISLTANAVWWVTAADMDGDGDIDVLAAIVSGDTIYWYENDGSENFTERIVSDDSTDPRSIQAVDLDGDGDLDVVAAGSPSSVTGTDLRLHTVTWYENDGSESFTKRTVASSVIGAWAAYTADVDGDGDLDIAVASRISSSLRWYKNNGYESFTERSITSSTDDLRSVYAADVDGDGDQDLLTAGRRFDAVTWWVNDGSGVFARRTITNAADDVRNVHAVDVDGDGDLDVLSAAVASDQVVWYEQQRTVFGATITAISPANLATNIAADVTITATASGALAPGTVSAASFTVDGSQTGRRSGTVSATGSQIQFDLARDFLPGERVTVTATSQLETSGGDRVAPYAWQFQATRSSSGALGSGVFGAATTIANRAATTIANRAATTIANRAATTIANRAATTIANRAATTIANRAATTIANRAATTIANRAATTIANRAATTIANRAATTIANRAATTIANRAATTIANRAATTIANRAATTIANRAATTIANRAATTIANRAATTIANRAATTIANRAATTIANRAATTIANRAATTIANRAVTTSGDTMVSADLDSDGDMDVVFRHGGTTVAWLENDGTGAFTEHSIASLGAFDDDVNGLVVADIDADGDMDVLVATDAGGVVWLKNDGAEGFTAQVLVDVGAVLLRVLDMDGDGDLDLVTGHRTGDSRAFAWYANNGSGAFSEQDRVDTFPGPRYFMEVADLDGDGDLDVLGGQNVWFENDGTHTFTERSYSIPEPSAGFQNDQQAADLDGDGDLDIISSRFVPTAFDAGPSDLSWYENNGSLTFTKRTIAEVSINAIHIADLDGDGDLDFATSDGGVAASGDESFAWYENNGAQTFTKRTIDAAAEPQRVHAADFDGDGDLDLIAGLSSTVALYEQLSIKIAVTGNGTTISDGDTTPDASDHTDFGTVRVSSGLVSRTFTVQNLGGLLLTLGTDAVSLSGTHAADFSVTAQPATTVAAGGSTTFTVQFDPSGTGTRSATVSVANDSDGAPYTFAIQGTGTQPSVQVTATDGNTTVSETGTTDQLSVVLSEAPTANVVLTVTTSDTGEATAGPGTLTFTTANWDQAQTVTVTGVDDNIADGEVGSVLRLAIASDDADYAALGTLNLGISTTDDEALNVSIADASVGEDDGTVVLTVSMTFASPDPVTLFFELADGTATQGNDFDIAPMDGFTIDAGETSKTVTVFIINDDVGEPTETFTASVSNPSAGTVTDGTATITITDDDAPLPVELTAFEAVVDQQAVVLTWQTASETNNAGFHIELQPVPAAANEQPDATPWRDVQFVQGHGTTLQAQRYQTRLDDLDAGTYRVRLRQVDFDATFDYSPEVEVTVELAETFVLSPAYPNPFNPSAQFTLQVREAQHAEVGVYDASGRQVAQLHRGPLSAGMAHVFRLEASGWASGLYVIRVRGERFVSHQTITLIK
ncbi:MAG: hypothetical protein RhofKO_14140 [Rhodothermales bacterium]